jgi:hypothetical protein
MSETPRGGDDAWNDVKSLMGQAEVVLGPSSTRRLRERPEELATLFSAYKFVAKMLEGTGSVLELGCGEGLGAVLLGEMCASYTGVDAHQADIDAACALPSREGVEFRRVAWMGQKLGQYDAVVSLEPFSSSSYSLGLRLIVQTAALNVREGGLIILARRGDAGAVVTEVGPAVRRVLGYSLCGGAVLGGVVDGPDWVVAVGCAAREVGP